jgi:hypothetical protein
MSSERYVCEKNILLKYMTSFVYVIWVMIMMFNVTFNNISAIVVYHISLYWVHLAMSGIHYYKDEIKILKKSPSEQINWGQLLLQ